MKSLWRTIIPGVAILSAFALQASAKDSKVSAPVLLGTTGACNNEFPGGPCTQQSTLVELDPETGALIRTIGPVGFTVNGLAWDSKTSKLYASTAIGDTNFHGLIRINPHTGKGKEVDKRVVNFGLPGGPSPIHSITINHFGLMAGWYDEFGPGVTDTYVQIDKRTGIATEFPNTGIDTGNNGLSFDEGNLLWNIDTARRNGPTVTQKAYFLNPADGKPVSFTLLSPPTPAALGDFNPANNLYYGLNFQAFDPAVPTFIVVVDPLGGTVTTLGQTVDDLHTLAFVKSAPEDDEQ